MGMIIRSKPQGISAAKAELATRIEAARRHTPGGQISTAEAERLRAAVARDYHLDAAELAEVAQ